MSSELRVVTDGGQEVRVEGVFGRYAPLDDSQLCRLVLDTLDPVTDEQFAELERRTLDTLEFLHKAGIRLEKLEVSV